MRLGRVGVEMRYPAPRDRRGHVDGMKHCLGMVVGGEGCGAGDLGDAVAAGHRLARIRTEAHGHGNRIRHGRVSPKGEAGSAGMRAGRAGGGHGQRTRAVRRASSILWPFSPEGAAPSSAASAARAKSSGFGRLADHQRLRLAGTRQGFAATAPSARRASAILPSSMPQRGGGRDQREGEGGALAHLEVAGVCR